MDEDLAGSSKGLLERSRVENQSLHYVQRRAHRSNWDRYGPVLLGFAGLLALWNVLLLSASDWKSAVVVQGQDPAYFGSPDLVQIPFSHDWEGLLDQERDGYRYADEEWENIFPKGGGSIALSSEFVEQHGIPTNAARDEDDPDKRIYLVAGYHQLHCLSVVRDAIYYLNGTLDEWPDSNGFIWDHVLHCIEAVRLGLSCFLDPTLINLNATWPGLPNGQMHQCRNRDALHAFVTEHAHAIPKDHALDSNGG